MAFINFKRPYQLFSILSLDVVIGAVIGAKLSSQLLCVHPGAWFFLILALSVWIMYTADHLVDAWRLKDHAHTERHLFHNRNFKLLVIIVLGLSVFDFILVLLKLNQLLIYTGLIIFILTASYFGILTLIKSKRNLILQKELIIAFVYTSGIWAGPISMRNFILHNSEIILLSIFFLLAWADVLLFSVMEEPEDRMDQHHTFATNFGLAKSRNFIHFILFVVFGLSVFLIIVSDIEIERQASKLLMLMGFAIVLMNNFPDFFKYNYRYRYIGELIFWFPLLFFL